MFDPLCQLAPAINGWALFPSMAAMKQIFGADGQISRRGQSD
jgi:hypothetical protein